MIVLGHKVKLFHFRDVQKILTSFDDVKKSFFLFLKNPMNPNFTQRHGQSVDQSQLGQHQHRVKNV